jgi:hypothetical protein
MYSVNTAVGGQTSAYRFVSVMNPSGSGKNLVVRKANVIGYAGVLTLNTVPLVLSRITAASGGSVQAASVVNKFVTSYPNSASEIRMSNPTVTAGAKIFSFAPPFQGLTVGAFAPAPQVVVFGEAELMLVPGEGVAFHQEAAGLAAQLYNIYLSWTEQPQ